MNPQNPLWDCAGWFGKIPSHGDFLTRRLPASFVEPWDQWLSDELYEARSGLGERWRAAYEAAPIRCFSLGRDVLDDRVWYGLLAPSADRVGRQFPLTLALSPALPAAPPLAWEWWDALVNAARRGLAPHGTADGLDHALADFVSRQTEYPHDHREPTHLAVAGREPVPEGDSGHGHRHLPPATIKDRSSAWWSWAPEEPTATVPLIFDGLPRGRGFLQLLAAGEI
jgi:type VI secretion system protein ImpM